MNDVNCQSHIGIKGAYSYQVIDDSTGDILVDAPEQDNLILDSYLDLGTPYPSAAFLCIGAGVVTPPTVTDTDLGNQIKSSVASFSFESFVSDGDYFTRKASTVRDFTNFNGQEVSEVGVRSGGASGVLVTRALIKDAQGVPTTIQVNPGQTLRLTYSLYFKVKKVLGSGVFSTPHGDLNWIIAPTTNYYLDSFTSNQFYSLKNYAFSLPFRSASSSSNNVKDIPNRKVTCTATLVADSSDRSTGTTGQTDYGYRFLMTTQGGSDYPFMYVSSHYTLPANYDFSITWEITWGRLP